MRPFMRPYVLKEWKADTQPVDNEDHYVVIHGRRAGLLSWLLNLFKISATTSLTVTSNRVEFTETSLAGVNQQIIPLENLSSTFWGYHKPWLQSILIFFLLTGILSSIGSVLMDSIHVGSGTVVVLLILGVALCLAISIAYFVLNRVYVWGVLEISGVVRAIPFKSSVIEGKNVTEESAAHASQIMQALIEAKNGKYMPQ